MNNASVYEAKHNPSPSYVTQYHMTREPFSENIEDDLFYAEPSRQQKLDILLHLTQYGNELVLVTGPSGSGKTTLLQQYIKKALPNWVVARVDAQTGLDERKLTQQLFHQMGMDFHGATHSELFEHMQHHFDALQHSARQAVLLIDNAEHLPVTALNRVLEMAALVSADNKPLLRIILFGTKQLNENFDGPLLDPHAHIVQRSVELPPFGPEQTTHYILHRLSAANFSADKPFTDAALHKIHKQSNGWPGRINSLAHNLLIETLPTGGLGGTSGFNKLHAAGALGGLLVIGALLFFQDELTALFEAEPTRMTSQADVPPVATPTTETTPLEATPDTTASTEETQPTENASPALTEGGGASHLSAMPGNTADTADTADTENLAAETTEATMDVADNAASQQTAPPAETPVTQPPVVEAPIAKTPPTAETLPPVKTTPASQPSPIPDDLPGFRNAWILQQDPNQFTLQLVAGYNIKTLRDFIRQHPVDGPLAIYHHTRKGKPWFGLIQQRFPSKQAAVTARSQLPAAVQKEGPWVRRFAALQKDLRRAP